MADLRQALKRSVLSPFVVRCLKLVAKLSSQSHWHVSLNIPNFVFLTPLDRCILTKGSTNCPDQCLGSVDHEQVVVRGSQPTVKQVAQQVSANYLIFGRSYAQPDNVLPATDIDSDTSDDLPLTHMHTIEEKHDQVEIIQ